MSEQTPESNETRRRVSRRAFLKGAAVGGAAVWAASVLPRRAFIHDPHRPPKLYEYFLDNFWFDSVDLYGQEINAPLKGRQTADIVIVGGGFAGMASAYHLARRFGRKRIVLLEGACCGYGASGRNGGFADTGFLGFDAIYDREGPEGARAVYDATVAGLDQIKTFVAEHGIDCDLEPNGSIALAMEEHHLEELQKAKRRYDAMGLPSRLIERGELQKTIRSERFIGGFLDPARAILNPAKLARGMKRLIESMGVEVFERSKVMRIEPGKRIRIVTEFGEVEAPSCVLALNGYAPHLGFFRSRLLPLCNYVVATEPLSDRQMEAIGWGGRQGLSDMRLQFMYFRLTADNRIVFGGESAPYYYDSDPSSGNHRPAIEKLQRSILTTFPQLEGVRFTHSWGGTMGFTGDFTPSIGVLGEERNLYYAVGFSGEGVVMTQVAGKLIAQLMAAEQTDLTRLPIVNKSLPYLGPEPFRYPVVKLYERLLHLMEG
jgi:glycine/D-amino acid oxidase-like deaminating enzyme